MIRPAVATDLAALVAMGARFLSAVYGDAMTGSATHMHALVSGLLTQPDGLLLVDERDGAIAGMFGAVVFAHPMSGERTASELFWWVNPEARGSGVRLMKRAEQWAKAHGATRMLLIAPTPDVEALYQRLAYRKLETAYHRSL